LRAIICDFNGVIVDDETPHFVTYQQALNEFGIELSRDDYYGAYHGMDERNCTIALMEKIRGRVDPALLRAILERKAGLFRAYASVHKPRLFPGVVAFVKAARQRYRLAIASGGRREQIEDALRGTRIERDFPVIVTAEDTVLGKPEPTIYRIALQRLNETDPRPEPPISAGQVLVIEDSQAGLASARAAGMKVLAVATTYPADRLTGAHLVLPDLRTATLDRLEALFQ